MGRASSSFVLRTEQATGSGRCHGYGGSSGAEAMPQGRLSTTGDATWPARCYGVGVLMWCCMAIASGLWRTPHSSEGRPCIPRRHKEALVAAQWRQYFLTRAGFVFGLMQAHLAVIAQDNQGRARNDMAPVTRSITAFSSDGLGTSYTNSFARPLFNAVVVAVSWIMAGEHWLYRASTIAATCGALLLETIAAVELEHHLRCAASTVATDVVVYSEEIVNGTIVGEERQSVEHVPECPISGGVTLYELRVLWVRDLISVALCTCALLLGTELCCLLGGRDRGIGSGSTGVGLLSRSAMLRAELAKYGQPATSPRHRSFEDSSSEDEACASRSVPARRARHSSLARANPSKVHPAEGRESQAKAQARPV